MLPINLITGLYNLKIKTKIFSQLRINILIWNYHLIKNANSYRSLEVLSTSDVLHNILMDVLSILILSKILNGSSIVWKGTWGKELKLQDYYIKWICKIKFLSIGTLITNLTLFSLLKYQMVKWLVVILNLLSNLKQMSITSLAWCLVSLIVKFSRSKENRPASKIKPIPNPSHMMSIT